jgi:hypothetical protein
LAFLGFSVKRIGSHSTRFYGRSVQRRSLRLVPSDALVPLWARLVPWLALRPRKEGPAVRRRGQVNERGTTIGAARGAVRSCAERPWQQNATVWPAKTRLCRAERRRIAGSGL